MPQFGLIAEDVEKVDRELIVRDEDGKVSTVRYEAVNAMLLNEFLKEHRKVQEQDRKVQQLEVTAEKHDLDARIAQQQKQIEALTASFKEQAAQIQKVSEQLEASKSSPRLVADNR